MKLKSFSAFLCLFITGAITICAAAELTNQQKVAQTQVTRRVSVEEFTAMLAERNSVILDVRTLSEFDTGHIKNAINLDFRGSGFESNLSKLDKSKTYLVYCASGNRSAQACKTMSQLGFLKLIDLAPGFSGWRQAKKPIEK